MTMQIDLFTYVAQLINFALLVFLLHRFLYRPITSAMAAREENIAARFHDAEAEREKAHQEAVLFHEKRTAFDAERDALLTAMQQEVADQREAMMLAARAEVDELQQSWLLTIEQEQQHLAQTFRERTIQQVLQLSSHLLSELADVELETKIIKRFLERLRMLEQAEQLKLIDSFAGTDQAAVIYSAFPVAQAQRHQIDAVLQQVLVTANKLDASSAKPVRTRYVDCPELLAGIELRLHDYELTWTVRDELKVLSEELNATFEIHTG